MSARHLSRAGARRNIQLEVAPGTSPSGEEGVLLIRRHESEPLCLTFLSYEAAADLAHALRQALPSPVEEGLDE